MICPNRESSFIRRRIRSDSLQFLTSDMKHYREKFYISEEKSKKITVKLKPEYIKKEVPEGCILPDSRFSISFSCIYVDKNGVDKYWHLKNLSRSKYPEWEAVVHIRKENIDDSECSFNPEVYEFDAPEIGEQFFVWSDGRIYDAKCSFIRMELGHCWKYFLIGFQEPGGKNIMLSGKSLEEFQENITKYCKKEATEFDNEFWSARYEELREQKDKEYKDLEKDYENYRDYYG